MPQETQGLALFDFDGTLVPTDSQVIFCGHICRRWPWRRLLMLFFWAALPLVLLGKRGIRILKRLFLIYLWGLDRATIKREAARFAREVIKPMLYDDVVARLQEHRDKGDLCVMATASPSLYAQAIADLLGFDLMLGTDVLYGDRFPFFPRLARGNNKGAVKVERLRELGIIPTDGVRADSTAYTDSIADLPMLQVAGHRVLVHPSTELLRAVEGERELTVLEPPRPWATTGAEIRAVLRFLWGIW